MPVVKPVPDQFLALVVPDWAQYGEGNSSFDWQLALQLPEQGFVISI